MNRRRHVPHLFSAYIDGDLSPARARAVETHLAACPACARELEQWRAVLRLVSYHAAVTCPIDCAEAVLQRIAAQPFSSSLLPPPSSPGRPLIPALACSMLHQPKLDGDILIKKTEAFDQVIADQAQARDDWR